MAKFYGRTSRYLLKNDAKYYFLGAGLILLPLFLVWLSLKIFTFSWSLVIAIVCILFVASIARSIQTVFARKGGRYYRGWGGEKDIQRELQNLSDDWSVFQDLTIGENRGNIDFVVVGPKGIFLLEVKSHRGEVGLSGDALTLWGKPFKDKNFFRQVHGQTWALKTYLKNKTGSDLFINSVLVFSSPRAVVNFGYQPISNIYIIQRDFLLGLFSRFSNTTYPISRSSIEQALLNAVKR
jgi:hypothetical protein